MSTARAYDRDGRQITASIETIEKGLAYGHLTKHPPVKPAAEAPAPVEKLDKAKK